ncbi:universal stress protein [Salinibaculum rarum]|uniref:universal stress protein n=1 Tax=Salinibaculum rarum TaxID=3058903 RepID=UPI00265F719A|nr:universal stress protein [Salinibaculum sp. KK48]
MPTRILVPMDDSDMAQHALRFAFEHFSEPEVTVLHVVGTPSSMLGSATGFALEDDLEAAADEAAEQVFDLADTIAAEYDQSVDTSAQVGHPVRAILNAAESGDFDTLVIGTHSGSLADRLFIGNVTEKIVRQSPIPVTVAR